MQHQSVKSAASVRRADWRFLLPDALDRPYRHLVLLGGPDDLPEIIQRAGIAEQVTRKIPTDRCADAVIILDSSMTSLGKAARCLEPGGVLYGEVDRRSLFTLSSTPNRVSRSLNHAGLSLTGVYWIRPDLIRRQVYVPLHVAGPLKWYLQSVLTASSPAASILEFGLEVLARAGNRAFTALAPCFAFTALAGPITDMPPSVLRHPALPPELHRRELVCLVITHGTEDFRRVTILPFAPHADRPLAILKLARLPHYNECTEIEQSVLRKIRSALSGTLRESIPQPLGIVRCGQLMIGLETCVLGRSLANITSRWSAPLSQKIDALYRAASWLTEFNCQVQVKRSNWGDDELNEWVERPLAAYERAFGLTTSETRLFAAARTRARSLCGVSLPTVWVHWDFSEENILRVEEGISVIDWESGSPGPPLFDLLFFAIHWSFSACSLNTEASRLRAYRQLLAASRTTDPVFAAVRNVVEQYMARLDIDRRFQPLFLVILWVVKSLGRFPWQPGRSSHPRDRNRFVGYIGVLAEQVEPLFSERETH